MTCGHCDQPISIDDCDTGGVCRDGDVLCPKCDGQIDSVTGEVSPDCGECEMCLLLDADPENKTQQVLF